MISVLVPLEAPAEQGVELAESARGRACRACRAAMLGGDQAREDLQPAASIRKS